MRILGNIGLGILVSMGAAIALALFLVVFVILPFTISSVLAGQTHNEYRCADGVVESRTIYWGISLDPFAPIDGDPAGACK